MLIWQEIFLKPIGNRLTNICFKMIDIERNNHVIINTHLIEGVIDSYSKSIYDELIYKLLLFSGLQF
jgi:hypothetical protein